MDDRIERGIWRVGGLGPRIGQGLGHVIGLLAFLGVCMAAVVEAREPSLEEDLPPGVGLHRGLNADEVHRYRPLWSAGRRWAVRLDQLGTDASLEVRWPDGSDVLRVDSPLDRDGVEWLLLPPWTAAAVELDVEGLAIGAEPGSYRLQLVAVDSGPGPRTEDDGDLVAALDAMTAAGEAYARGGGDGRRQALEHYGRAVDLWRRLQRPRFAAQSLYAVAVLHRLLGEEEAGLRAAREVLGLWRALGDRGRQADTLNEIGLIESAAGRGIEARQAFQEALTVQDDLGDLFRQAATANNLCLTHMVQGEFRQAEACYGPALARIRAAGDTENEAVALTNLGWVHRNLGQVEPAFEHFYQAVAILRAEGKEGREAETLSHLALLHRQVEEPEEAAGLYLRALDIFRREGKQRWESAALHNLGVVYRMLGDPARASVFLRQALQLKQELGLQWGANTTLRLLASLDMEAGRVEQARSALQQVLESEQSGGKLRGAAITSQLLGKSFALDGDHRTAVELFTQALKSLGGTGDRRQQALAKIRLGVSLMRLGRLREARETLDEASLLFRDLRMGLGDSHARYWLAETERAAGSPEAALQHVNEALDVFEFHRRTAVGDPDLRATLSGLKNDVYALRIELLMGLHEAGSEMGEATPGGSSQGSRLQQQAFETSELARARGLVERLRERAAEGYGNDPSSPPGGKVRAARRQLHQRASRLRRLSRKAAEKGLLDQAEADMLQALSELENLEAEARKARGEDTGRSAEAVSVGVAQTLLGDDTVLLEYALGEDRSFLFRLSAETFEVFELPGRAELETLARRVHEGLSSPQTATADMAEERRRLADLLLGAALPGLGQKRLAVVADGALHYLPFAALPVAPGSGDGPRVPLMRRFEIVYLPSISALATQRRRIARRPEAPKWAAVLADPVFEADDTRLVASLRATGNPGPSATAQDPPSKVARRSAEENEQVDVGRGTPSAVSLSRLRQSRREAEMVASLGPPEEVLLALDFDASRKLALSGDLRQFRIVHFATHGIVDARYPALSGLALSQFDAAGRPQDGYLRLHDIYGLDLRADLVVLSACRTALGKEVLGEGLMGLTRGFFDAGARQIVASLWSVPDGATAELMRRFYGALVDGGLDAAAALHQAQRSMAEERRWRAPRNWAGFVLLGDWQPIPEDSPGGVR